MIEKNKSNRRTFFKTTTLGALGSISIPAFLGGCNSSSKDTKLKNVVVPELREKALDGKPLKAGLIGCGGRGTGAAVDFLNAGDGLQITTIGDVFQSKVDSCRRALFSSKEHNIPEENCFSGFDAYKKVIDSDIDVVLLCTPPVFRPLHFDYAIRAGKNCFVEKPCAVDPVGARQMLISGKQAEQQNLSVMSGTIRRSQKNCLETYRRVAGGAIGEIVSAHVSRMGGALWFIQREKEWNDMEYMMHNWVNFCWTSGDHIVEQFIHEIDQMSWFMGDIKPIRAEATGGRQRRVTGDMYDFFSIEYMYENGIRTHCTSRQIGGCDNQTIIMVYGTKGYTDCNGKIFNLDGSIAWEYNEDEEQPNTIRNPFIQEHVRLISAIRSGKTINDIEQHVQSTLMAIMGRESAYTGRFITWDQIMASNQKLGPETYQFGPIEGILEEIPRPGVAPKI